MVVIEPVQSSNPRLDNKEFLNGLREVCSECDVLLMFDEVITGFRIEYGGCCLLYTSPSPRDGLLSRMPSSA